MSSPSVSFGGRPGPRRCGAEEVIDLHIQCDNEASRASGATAFKVDVAIATPPFGAPLTALFGIVLFASRSAHFRFLLTTL
jgi:hypothetical protein